MIGAILVLTSAGLGNMEGYYIKVISIVILLLGSGMLMKQVLEDKKSLKP